ncbi:beta-ketoacyl-[acyl-carrier-protein] synthase family protein [Proteiniphilum acetatigenes]|uniref:beta-ketoacyl-[acyl-carrier-protein] synthase family protein n=1 Tax=Proteiniphilum acetatigenes TaxID=294710 RepID=UPI00036A5CB3|nr:beta-ketoacyl synthase N-terminal-like domain-containing protein [Proteiniphilum acetatigenes]
MEREMEHPVIYLTADALISSLGFSSGECRERMFKYQSGVQPIRDSQFYSELFYGAKIDDNRLQLLVPEHNLYDFSRFEQLLILSIRQTLGQSGVDIRQNNCGFILASTKGNIGRLSAGNETGDELLLSHSAEKIAAYFGFSAKPVVLCNACISGISAMIVAKRLIENGMFTHMVVAGGDELSDFIVSGFHAFKSVSTGICKPYDAGRDGLSLGEAIGSLLLTSDKKHVTEQQPAMLLGGAITNDANHISGPSRTGEELHMAIEQALLQAGISANDVSFVNAHGTATIYNDEMESKALYLSGLSGKPLQSLKPYFGHTLGAAGVIETIICKQQLENDIVFGVPGFETIGVPYPLNIDALHRPMNLTYCLKTASGFGGCNATIVIGKESVPGNKPLSGSAPLQGKQLEETSSQILKRAKIVSKCNISALGVELNDERVLANEPTDDFPTFIRKAYASLNLSYRKFYKMDDLSKLGFITTAWITRSVDGFSGLPPESKGIIIANRSSSLDTDIHYRQNLDAVGDREASPAIFVYTLPNVMLGEICIYWKMKGENTFFIQREFDKDFLIQYAGMVMNEQDLNYCIVGWCDLLDNNFLSEFYLMER